jgi:hypothetical protein
VPIGISRTAPSQKKLQRAVAEEKPKHPGASVELWAMDEHRLGLKPITRGVWAPIGERPIALGHHRYEWLYVSGFVVSKTRLRHDEPATGRTVWNVSNAVCKEMFQAVLADFAKSIGVGKKRRVVLQLDRAGWHGPENLNAPDGIRLVFQPSHSPQLQPAEHLWAFVDEPLANTYFETIEDLDQVVGERCVALMQQPDMIRDSTLFHWWPRQRATK